MVGSKGKLSLLQSIFLRYLPLPMVIRLADILKSTTEQRKQQLAIFRTEKHERETLIWKKEMKDHLQNEIWNNSALFIEDLYLFVSEAN